MAKEWKIEDSLKVYDIARWGKGHFTVNSNGHLCILPSGEERDGPCIDLAEVMAEIERQKIGLPVVLRFHDILRSQVIKVNKTFNETIEEASFRGRYFGVFPIKVNQMREVLEEIVDAGEPYNFGLEAGSKTELLAALALNTNLQSLTIVNGHKDDDFLQLALLGVKLGRKIIIVIEKYSEIGHVIKLSKQMEVTPMLGIRAKLSSEGSGKWSGSSGDHAKFGLTVPQIVKTITYLKEINQVDTLKLLHFHIGSQITDIRAIKDAVAEAGRIYAKLRKMNVPIEFFDVGGGLGVDYDGQKNISNSSMNYNLKEYVEDVVYNLMQICDLEDVDHPHIVSETGRAIAAPHSCVITNVFGNFGPKANIDFNILKSPGEHILIKNMREILDETNQENYQESYNDIRQLKEEMLSAFKLGIVSLEERSKAETIYWKVLVQIDQLTKDEEGHIPEFIQQLRDELADQYLCNFSVFQSALDFWAIGLLMPIVPIKRLDEEPTHLAQLADITCDSDGKIDKFIDVAKTRSTLPIHELRINENYLIGLFLTGAYQDIMGDNHNLFGRLNEVHIFSDIDDPKHFYIEEVIWGQTSKDILTLMQYNTFNMATTLKRLIDKQIQRRKIRPREGIKLIDFYEKCLSKYTYLDPDGSN